MVTIFQKGQLFLAMDGEYERLLLLSLLTFLIRSILHDPKSFNNPMEYQPERYLKDGKLNSDVIDPDTVAFGYGRRSVINPTSFRDIDLMISSLVFVLEDTWSTTCYTQLCHVC
jgi:Cytochrome P450